MNGPDRVAPMGVDLARALAGAFLAGEWTSAGLVERGALVCGRRARWLPALARQVLGVYPQAPRDRPRELAGVVRSRPAARRCGRVHPLVRMPAPARMVTNPWHLPEVHDLADLATLLRVTVPELEWFADPRRWARSVPDEALRHYRVTARPGAGGTVRVLEAPKPRLKVIQRRLLVRLVAPIPPHDAAHGFRRGRSVASHAAEHAGRAVVIRLDLEGFFAAVSVGRVYGVFRTAGYPEPVAHALAGLSTTVLSLRAWQGTPTPGDPALLEAHWRLGRKLAAPHLPQGAPTSPALANLAAHRLDVRLCALARAWGGHYTRYADDLALSADRGWRTGSSRLLDAVGEVVRDEGFALNERKTAVASRGGRQMLGDLVVNERPKVPRDEVDRLRATLHNCDRHGPSGQNWEGHGDYRAHLTGRVAWVAQHDPARGAVLRGRLERIDWTR